jgi:hypothetical protein
MVREQNEGAVFLFELDQRGVAAAAALPTWIEESCHVRWAISERGCQILHRLARISRDLEEDFALAFERQHAWRNTEVILKVLAFHARRGNWRFVIDWLWQARWEHLKMLLRWLTGLGKGDS